MRTCEKCEYCRLKPILDGHRYVCTVCSFEQEYKTPVKHCEFYKRGRPKLFNEQETEKKVVKETW